MSNEGLTQRWPGRAPLLLTVLSIAIAGVAFAGCGGGSDKSTSEAQERVEKGLHEAKQGLEKGKEEVKKGFEKAEEEAKQGIEKGKEATQKGIEEAEKYGGGY